MKLRIHCIHRQAWHCLHFVSGTMRYTPATSGWLGMGSIFCYTVWQCPRRGVRASLRTMVQVEDLWLLRVRGRKTPGCKEKWAGCASSSMQSDGQPAVVLPDIIELRSQGSVCGRDWQKRHFLPLGHVGPLVEVVVAVGLQLIQDLLVDDQGRPGERAERPSVRPLVQDDWQRTVDAYHEYTWKACAQKCDLCVCVCVCVCVSCDC